MPSSSNRFGSAADEQLLLNEISLDTPWALIERFSTLDRESGSEGEWQAAEYIREQLDRFGVSYRFFDPELLLSLPRSAGVRLGREMLAAKAISFSASTPETGVTGQLVHAPAAYATSASQVFGTNAADADVDVAGKIVITEGLGWPARASELEARGAIAQIHVNPGERMHWGNCSTIWGTPDLSSMDRLPTTPVIVVSRSDGERLIALARDGGQTVTVHAQLERAWKRCPIVVAEIPGSVQPDKFLLVHGHLDSWAVGIGDNAVGNATLLELARIFNKHRDKLARSIRIAWWPGHSMGRYAGSTWYADQFALDLAENCVSQTNIDSPGCRWATEYEGISWMAETDEFCQAAIKDATGRQARGERPLQAGDYSFNNIGITSFFMLLSTIPAELAKEKGLYGVGGCGGNNEWHHEDDRIDVVDPQNILRDLRVYVTALSRVANADLLPFDFRQVARDFESTLLTYQAAAGDRFGFGAALAEVRTLEAELDSFYAAAQAAQSAGASLQPFNEAIMRIARVLVPINFAREGRFWHDPAVPIPALPDLSPASTLADLPEGSDVFRFTLAHLVRGQNRLIDALRQARRELGMALCQSGGSENAAL